MLKGSFDTAVQNKLFIVHPDNKIDRVPIIPEVFNTIKPQTNVLKGFPVVEPGVYLL